jgi:hypothetical protein
MSVLHTQLSSSSKKQLLDTFDYGGSIAPDKFLEIIRKEKDTCGLSNHKVMELLEELTAIYLQSLEAK